MILDGVQRFLNFRHFRQFRSLKAFVYYAISNYYKKVLKQR
jgi:hypothetical protein